MTDRLTMIADAVARLRPRLPSGRIIECFECGADLWHRGHLRRRLCSKCTYHRSLAGMVDKHGVGAFESNWTHRAHDDRITTHATHAWSELATTRMVRL